MAAPQGQDGRSFVQAVLDAVGRAGMVAVDMRYFAAREGRPAEYCRARVRDSEVYLAVVGFRYGSMVPDEDVSYTELEFREAAAAGIPRLVFLLDDAVEVPAVMADPDRGPVDGFRRRLRDAGLIVRTFTSDAGLELEAFHALTDTVDTRRPPPPRELPPDVFAFTGRTAELDVLNGLASRTPAGSSAVVISAVLGSAGVGKTALAVHWAHRVAERFPDGQLYVDLRGYDPEVPLPVEVALAGLLRSLGLDAEAIPPGLAERAARYRSLLAGRRVLVVLDNAFSSEQVRPLLPGGAPSLALVTSRDSLTGLVARYGAARVEVGVLAVAEAVALLRALVGARVDAEPAAAATLAEQCAALPLALRVAAELVVSEPEATLAELVRELADEHARLDLLDGVVDDRMQVRAVFSWSLRQLREPVARLFRLLGLHPGRDLDRYAVAALAGEPVGLVERLMADLVRAHLVERLGRDRFRMHDLLRTYAAELAASQPQSGRDEALNRLFGYYLSTADAAVDVLFPAERHRREQVLTPTTAPTLARADVGTGEQAMAWLDVERPNLVAVLGRAVALGRPDYPGQLALTLWPYLYAGAHYVEALAVNNEALRAARRDGHREGESAALNRLGSVYWLTGRYPDALESYRAALAIRTEIGDRAGEGSTLGNLGLVYDVVGRLDEALIHHRQALALRRELHDRVGAGNALDNIGVVLAQQGHYAEAIEHHREALSVRRDIDDRAGAAASLINLGTIDDWQGRYPQALEHHRQALAIHEEIGYRAGVAEAVDNIGKILRHTGHHDEAAAHHDQALGMFRLIGERAGEASALNGLGATHRHGGRYDTAVDLHRQALAIMRSIGFRAGQAEARNELAIAYRGRGQFDQALAAHREALKDATEVGHRHQRAWILNELGATRRASGDPIEARVDHEAALAEAREIGDRHQQANALRGIAHALLAVDDPVGAHRCWRESLDIYAELGVPEADEVSPRV